MSFDIPEDGWVRTLIWRHLTAGRQVYHWDGRDDFGRKLPAGAYPCTVYSFGRVVPFRSVVEIQHQLVPKALKGPPIRGNGVALTSESYLKPSGPSASALKKVDNQ